jgi:hypothetical protein
MTFPFPSKLFIYSLIVYKLFLIVAKSENLLSFLSRACERLLLLYKNVVYSRKYTVHD